MTFPDPFDESYPPSLWETEVVPGVQAASSTPSDSWTKAAIQEWLDENQIGWDSSMTKAQLLELITGAPEPEPPAEETAPEPEPEGGG